MCQWLVIFLVRACWIGVGEAEYIKTKVDNDSGVPAEILITGRCV